MRALLLVCLLLASCAGRDDDDTVVTDSTIEDSATQDSGSTDSGSTDSGTTDTGIGPVDADGDGYTADVDCDDDPNGCGADCFPGNPATDDCDGNDNDCDNSIDEDTGTLWYPDCDGDGDFADDGVTGCTEPTQTTACDDGALPDGGFTGTLPGVPDCDDEDVSLNLGDEDGDGVDSCTGDCDDDPSSCGALCTPGSSTADLCDGFDVDCDGAIGEDDSRRWYADCDGDGFFGDVGVASCEEPRSSPCADGAPPDGGWTVSLPATVDCDDEDSALRPDDLDGDGVSSCDGDCDDDPGACGAACSPNLTTDGCDSYDNDCDGTSDENPDISWYLDADGDGSTVGTGTQQCDSPGADYLAQQSAVEDCDDGDASRDSLDRDSDGQTTCDGDCDDDPAACGDQCNTTIALDGCDSFDNDCDNILDEDPGSTVWYLDEDQDGWVSDAPGIGQCASPGANYTTRLSSVVDCDDTDPDANYDDLDEDGFSTCEDDCDDDPAACGADCFPDNPAPDTCDEADNDCDDALDEDPPTWYPDADRDGDTAATGEVAACDAPTTGGDWLTSPSAEADCDDTDAALNHDDADGDTVDTCAGDCDDDPLACGANCSPNNTLDECDVSSYNNDCDGQIDEDAPTWYLDDDQDGWSADAVGQAACSSPGADWSQTLSTEVDCDDGDAGLNHDDADTDNVDTCAGDCNDGNGDIFPGAAEICDGDGTTAQQIDNDCDGGTNPDFTTWYTDLDGDGDGLAGSGVEYCLAQVADRSTSNTDCDDDDPDRAGIFTELCDGNGSPAAQFDNDCDSGTNPTTSNWYTDLDADGFGAETATAEAWCLEPTAGYAQSNDDCDDDPGACGDACNPGINLDTCDEATLGDGDWTNGVVQYDNNCSGVADENPDETWYIDEDGDGFEAPDGTLDCLSPGAAYTRNPNNPTDCVDQNPFINPDAIEVFGDQVDQDCDGRELCFTDADGDGYGEGFSATMPSLLVFDPNGFHSEMYAAGLRAGLSPITVASTPAELAAAGPHDMLAVNIDLGTPQNVDLWDSIVGTVNDRIADQIPVILNTPRTSGLSVGTPIPLSLGSPERPTYETAYSDLLLQTRSAFDVSPYTLNVAPEFSQFLETSTIADTTDMWTLARAANGEAVILGFDKGRVIVHGLETEDVIPRSTRERHIHETELVSLFAAEMRFQLRYYPDKLASVLEDTLGTSCALDKRAYKAFDCNGLDTSIPAMETGRNGYDTGVDRPDPDRIDSNCDGFDGNMSSSIWINPTGWTDASGASRGGESTATCTFAEPCTSPYDRVSPVLSLDSVRRPDMLIVHPEALADVVFTPPSGGTGDAFIEVRTSIAGGYLPDLSRDLARRPVFRGSAVDPNHDWGLRITDNSINSNALGDIFLEAIQIESVDYFEGTTIASQWPFDASQYGLVVETSSSSPVTIRHVDITAGRGAAGQAARANCDTFDDGDENCDGVRNEGPLTFDNFVNLVFTYGVDGQNGANGGAHGFDPNAAKGGAGGAGGVWNSSTTSLRNGQAGSDNDLVDHASLFATGLNGGDGGSLGGTSVTSACDAVSGSPGRSASDGANGALAAAITYPAGEYGSWQANTTEDLYSWIAPAGNDGTYGGFGSSGSGGGGGGACLIQQLNGGRGGRGGGGGTPGSYGFGGGGGGGSFGILVNSGTVTVQDSTITTGGGGSGAIGGAGGQGGSGGIGQSGVATGNAAGNGGRGGDGSDGGDGSGGGGGGGGLSAGIYARPGATASSGSGMVYNLGDSGAGGLGGRIGGVGTRSPTGPSEGSTQIYQAQ